MEGYLQENVVLKYITALENYINEFETIRAYKDLGTTFSDKLAKLHEPVAAARGAIAKNIDDYKRAHTPAPPAPGCHE